MVLTMCDLFNFLPGFDIAMVFRGERVHGFSFTRPVANPLPAKKFIIGFTKSAYYARAVVNGCATIPKEIQRGPNNSFESGIRFDPRTGVLEL